MKKSILFILMIFFALNFINLAYAANETSNTLLSSSFHQKDAVFDKPVILPESMKVLSKALFGLNNESEVTFSVFIILAVLFAIVFSVIHMTVSLIPLFSGKVTQYLISLIVTLIISVSGGMRATSTFLFNFSNGLKLISNFSIFSIIFSIIILLIIFFIAHKVINIIKKQYKIDEADKTARELVMEFAKSNK